MPSVADFDLEASLRARAGNGTPRPDDSDQAYNYTIDRLTDPFNMPEPDEAAGINWDPALFAMPVDTPHSGYAPDDEDGWDYAPRSIRRTRDRAPAYTNYYDSEVRPYTEYYDAVPHADYAGTFAYPLEANSQPPPRFRSRFQYRGMSLEERYGRRRREDLSLPFESEQALENPHLHWHQVTAEVRRLVAARDWRSLGRLYRAARRRDEQRQRDWERYPHYDDSQYLLDAETARDTLTSLGGAAASEPYGLLSFGAGHVPVQTSRPGNFVYREPTPAPPGMPTWGRMPGAVYVPAPAPPTPPRMPAAPPAAEDEDGYYAPQSPDLSGIEIPTIADGSGSSLPRLSDRDVTRSFFGNVQRDLDRLGGSLNAFTEAVEGLTEGLRGGEEERED